MMRPGRRKIVGAKAERLVNLTIALLEARRPLTFAELRRRTHLYRQADDESARRMFERDKDDLRRLGVPLEIRQIDFGDEFGYLVDRRNYELPDIPLTADEVAALALALHLTGEDGGRLTLAKLAARAPDPSDLDAVPAPRVTLAVDPIGDELAEAIVHRITVRFAYQTAAGDRADRTVDPYAVVTRHGAWYLVGRDHDRQAIRAFRLDRIEGRLHPVGDAGAFERPDDFDPRSAVQGPDLASIDVELAVRPEARWAVELRGGLDTGRQHDDRPVLRVPELDPLRDRAWLLGLGADVEVLAPPELREDIMAALRAVAERHGVTGSAAPGAGS
jgi:proteasome accessory factor B